MPGDDPVSKLGLTGPEVEEFRLCMLEPFEYEDEDEKEKDASEGHHHQNADLPPGTEVYTPGVREVKAVAVGTSGKSCKSSGGKSSGGSKNKGGVSTAAAAPVPVVREGPPFKLQAVGTIIPPYLYTDYQADSDDEQFVTGVAKKTGPLTIEEFESMIPILERELEEAKSFLLPRIENSSIKARCDAFYEETVGVLNLAKRYGCCVLKFSGVRSVICLWFRL